jgi:DNA-binding transcriptional MerR regulator
MAVTKPSNTGVHRPADLARVHGLSAQAVRNYERDSVLPPAERNSNGYRRFTNLHAKALSAYLALIPGHGYAASGEIMRAVNRGDIDTALRAIDHSHALLQRDRETLDAVEAAVAILTGTQREPQSRTAGPISALAHRLGVRPATLRKWERARILQPVRDRRPATASTHQTTSATPNSLTCCAAAGTGSTTSSACCVECATPAAPNRSPRRCAGGGNGSASAAKPCSPGPPGSPSTSTAAPAPPYGRADLRPAHSSAAARALLNTGDRLGQPGRIRSS